MIRPFQAARHGRRSLPLRSLRSRRSSDRREDSRTVVADHQLSKVDVVDPLITLSSYLKLRRWQPTGDGIDQPVGPGPLAAIYNRALKSQTSGRSEI